MLFISQILGKVRGPRDKRMISGGLEQVRVKAGVSATRANRTCFALRFHTIANLPHGVAQRAPECGTGVGRKVNGYGVFDLKICVKPAKTEVIECVVVLQGMPFCYGIWFQIFLDLPKRLKIGFYAFSRIPMRIRSSFSASAGI